MFIPGTHGNGALMAHVVAQVPTLNPRETAHVQVSVDFPSSPTDHAIIAVYTTLDDSSEVWYIIPMMEFLIENAADPNRDLQGQRGRSPAYLHESRPERGPA